MAATEAERLALIRQAMSSRHQDLFVNNAEFKASVSMLAEMVTIYVDAMAENAVALAVARASAAYLQEHRRAYGPLTHEGAPWPSRS